MLSNCIAIGDYVPMTFDEKGAVSTKAAKTLVLWRSACRSGMLWILGKGINLRLVQVRLLMS